MHITFPKANLQKAINVLQKVSQNKTRYYIPKSKSPKSNQRIAKGISK